MRLVNILRNILNKIDENLQIAKSYSRNYEVMVNRGTITSSMHIDNIRENGIYIIGADPPGGVNRNYVWSYVVVLSIYGNGNNFIHQFIIRPANGVLLMREHSGNPAKWSAWKQSSWTNL